MDSCLTLSLLHIVACAVLGYLWANIGKNGFSCTSILLVFTFKRNIMEYKKQLFMHVLCIRGHFRCLFGALGVIVDACLML